MPRTPVTEAVWRVLAVGFVGAIVALPFVLLFADRMPYIAIDASVMLGCALVLSVFCFGIVRVALLFGAAAGAAWLLSDVHVHPPVGVTGVVIGLAVALHSRWQRRRTRRPTHVT
jgi:hypothetical protein